MNNPTILDLETIEQEQQEEKKKEEKKKEEIDWQAITCCLCGAASCGDMCEGCLGFE